MITDCCIISEPYAGLHSQALGLAEAACLTPITISLRPRRPWSWVAANVWPDPFRAVSMVDIPPGLILSAGGTGAAVGAACHSRGSMVVQIQNPRISLRHFNLVVANQHDELSGPNVIVTRTALHRATPERLRAEAATWKATFAHLPRPLICVLVGGSNGRLYLNTTVAAELAGKLANLMRREKVGVALTPSRRTDGAVRGCFEAALKPLGAWVWDMQGENPYFGMLALADVIVVTVDSISMVSEAVATQAPVLLADLPGRSSRISRFRQLLLNEGRVRIFDGGFQTWTAKPMDDTTEAADEMRRRLGL